MKTAIFGTFAIAALALPALASAPESGLNVGEMVSAFHPTHVAGPLKGTDGCPPCTYGNRPMVQVWHNHDSEENLEAVVKYLDGKVANSKHEFKAFTIRVTFCDKCVAEDTEFAKQFGDTKVGIAHISSTDQAIADYKYSLKDDVKNTIFVYKNRKVAAKFVNFKADKAGLKALDAAIAGVDK
ncbi:MAG: hypothetical protein ACKVQS_08555 [Fimbriimonadaceae bacterium]